MSSEEDADNETDSDIFSDTDGDVDSDFDCQADDSSVTDDEYDAGPEKTRTIVLEACHLPHHPQSGSRAAQTG